MERRRDRENDFLFVPPSLRPLRPSVSAVPVISVTNKTASSLLVSKSVFY